MIIMVILTIVVIVVSTVCLHAGSLSQLDVARFAKKYPAVMTALLRSLLEVTVKYYKALLGCAPCPLKGICPPPPSLCSLHAFCLYWS